MPNRIKSVVASYCQAKNSIGDRSKDINRYRGWRSAVINFRNRIKRIIKKNPSLKNYLIEQYSEIYQDAIATMSEQFDIPSATNIESEKILSDDYFG